WICRDMAGWLRFTRAAARANPPVSTIATNARSCRRSILDAPGASIVRQEMHWTHRKSAVFVGRAMFDLDHFIADCRERPRPGREHRAPRDGAPSAALSAMSESHMARGVMPDVFENIERAPRPMLEMIAYVLELRASMPQQQEMQRTYLREIEFPEGAQVLEVGCGTGAIARVLARWPKVGEVVGVDPSPYLVDRARALNPGLPNLVFEVGDGRALGGKAARVAGGIMHTVRTHVQGPEVMLAEAHRVLRPGGWLGVCDGDFSTATLATGDLDPLEVCVHAFVEGVVNDPWRVRRMSAR